MIRFRTPTLIPLLFITCATAPSMTLGVWQLERLSWKRELLARVEAGLSAPVTDGLPAELTQKMEYRRVRVSGRYDYAHTLHFVGREPRGYYLLTPLYLNGGRALLVNRGWTPMDKLDTRSESGPVEGYLRAPRTKRMFSPENHPDKNVWFVEDLSQIETVTGSNLQPLVLEVTAPKNKGGYPIVSEGVVRLRNDHLGYAITWFALAAIGLIMFAIYHREKA